MWLAASDHSLGCGNAIVNGGGPAPDGKLVATWLVTQLR